jgi:diguanylate cyclase (GGDEF)-like protein
MDTNLTHLADADTSNALEVAPRVWWVGHVLPDDVFQCHVYLLEQGNQSVLFDPGSRLTFAGTLRKIEQVIPFTHIRYFVCHHQDPDIAAAMPLIDELSDRPDAVLVTHWRTRALLKHYGLKMPFHLVEEHDWRLPLEDRTLEFIFTPYAHFPGAVATFDPVSGILFSSDLFGGFTERPTLVATDESHFEALRPFHEHYMPSQDILGFALNQIGRHPVRVIAPQHGSIIPERLVPFMVEKLRQLDCGIYLFARENTDIQRLSRLNETLREITQTMLLYRDFRDIAERLCRVVARNLPVERIDYFARGEDGVMLTFSHKTRYSGFAMDPPPEVAAILGKTRAEWHAALANDPALSEQQTYGDTQATVVENGSAATVTIPLFSPQREVIEAAALIHLSETNHITAEDAQVIEQIILPLQVALEREVIYRAIEAERQKAYQRSIRDPLTGLFTRVYMQDVMGRHCSIHDRDDTAPVAAVMIDIDHFKTINDTHGHAGGDAVLRQLAEIIQARIREADIPVRFGGEEFVIFLVGASALGARENAERLRRAIESHDFLLVDGGRQAVTASLGVAVRQRFEPLEDLIRRADEALYRAKRDGRNQVVIA